MKNVMMMTSGTDRVSIRCYANAKDDNEFYSRMFMDDFQQNIVPIYGSKHEEVHCSLEPANEGFQKILIESLPSHERRYNRDFNDAILENIQFIAQYLVHDGYLVLEIVTQRSNDNETVYKLEVVNTEELKIKDNNIIQMIHKSEAERLHITEPIMIPLEKCFIIDFPSSLGGRDKYLKFIEEFKELGQQSPIMGHFRNTLTGHAGYSLMDHQRLHDLELWRKSKVYNWHHRGDSNKLFSSYYYFYRYLQFRKTRIKLRDHIVSSLKEVVTRIANKFGQRIELKIEGLISIEKIDETLEQWKTGKLDPNSVGEFF